MITRQRLNRDEVDFGSFFFASSLLLLATVHTISSRRMRISKHFRQDDNLVDCLGSGCPFEMVNAQDHAYPWLASCVSIIFLGLLAGFYYIFADMLQGSLVRIRPGRGGG